MSLVYDPIMKKIIGKRDADGVMEYYPGYEPQKPEPKKVEPKKPGRPKKVVENERKADD